jgi:hypothetical protein
MADKETSEQIAKIAGDLMDITEEQIVDATKNPLELKMLASQIRRVAASAVGQYVPPQPHGHGGMAGADND